MLVLSETTDVGARPHDVYDWFRDLTSNYRRWHPDHRVCRYVKGQPLQAGSVLYVEEYLHGRLHSLRLKLISTEPGREIRYRIGPGIRGDFLITPTASGAQLRARVCLGWDLPVIGRLIDMVIARIFRKRLVDLRRHMQEESQNLKALFGANQKS